MKNKIAYIISSVLVLGVLVLSCDKKDPIGLGPSYTSTGNPNNGNQTTTGSPTYTNPATDNTSMNIGCNGCGYIFQTCGQTNSLSLKGINGTIDVTLSFPTIIQTGTYNISRGGEANTCALTIINAPNQPSGIVWQGLSGIIAVTTTSNNIRASFNAVVCTQPSFNYPTVTASGVLNCSN